MSEWKKYRLGDLVTMNYGKSFTAEKRLNGDVPVYSSAGICGWHNDYLENSNAIIVGRKGNSGSVFYSKTPFYCIDTAYYILPDKSYNLKFLYYKLLSLNLKRLTSDSAVPGLNRETSYAQEITIPDLLTQTQIASILTSFDDKIELLEQMNQTLETMAQTIFKDWFVDFNFPGFDGELVDGLPKGWRKGKLGDVLNLLYGKALKAENRALGIFPVIGSSGIVGFHNTFVVNGPGIVIGRKGTIGEVIWVYENFFPIDTTFFVEDMIDVTDLYYHYFLLKEQNFKKLMSDSAVPGLNRNQALGNEVVFPDANIVRKFNNVIATFFRKKESNLTQIRTLTHLRDTLLPKLMSGKIKII